ncbi:MAG: hypothetical protein JRN67_08900, partial [Nitrososphaerota archaeon]|nr:hypothetical protein [Nitrososphaerota archaeon]
TLPPSVTFPAGDLYYSVNFTTTTLPGTTTIYAVAQGYQTANLTLKTETFGGIPTALKVFLSPNQIMAQTGMTSTVVVEAVDAFGNPVNLANSVSVSLSSSITQVGNVSSSLTIPANKNYAETSFSATNTSGETVITASAESLAPGYAVMTTINGSSSTPNALAIQFAPPVLFSDGGTHQSVVVETVNSTTGNPSPAIGNTIVTLTSSTLSVGVVQSVVVIPSGETYAYATFTTTGLAGNTTITATASDFITTQGNLALVTKAATTLGVFAVPDTVIADNQTLDNLIVQLRGSSGNPEKSIVPVTVSLQSLYPATGTVPSQVTIPANSNYASIPLTTTSLTGRIEIVAFATGFELGQVIINSTLLSLNATMTPSPAAVPVGGTSKIALQVLSGDFPVQNATVQWTVTAGHISPVLSSTNASGYSSALVVAQTNLTRILVSAEISAPGYSSRVMTASMIVTGIVDKPPSHPSGILGILTIELLFIPLYIVIAIVAVGVGVGVFFIRRRSASGEYEADEE